MILWSEAGVGEFVRKLSIIYGDRLGAVAATAAAAALRVSLRKEE